MPGTWGSLAALIIFWFIPADAVITQSLLVFSAIILGFYFTHQYTIFTGKKDPGEVVLDEVAGMWITLYLIPHTMTYYLAGFILFRILDIVKPLLIDKVQRFRGGFGIMLDDILAGYISWVVILGIKFLS